MSQHDMIVDNGSGSTVRSDLNAAIQALASTNSGNSRPSTAYAGQLWLDTNTPSSTVWTLYMYDGTDDIFLGHVDSTNNAFSVATSQASDVASASTIDLDAAYGMVVDVTGTTGISTITLSKGRVKIVRFTGALTLTHGSNLVLPGAANITTAAGDYAILTGYASSVVRCSLYQKASGLAVVASVAGMTFISSATASSSASVQFTSGLDSTYDVYKIIGRAIVPATNGVYLYSQYSTDGGSSYLSTTYTSQTVQQKSTSNNGTAPTDGVHITPNTSGYFISNASNDGVNFEMNLYSPSGSLVKYVDGSCTYLESGSSVNVKGGFSGAYRGGTSAVNALRFLMSSGNISTGTFYLYGIKKS